MVGTCPPPPRRRRFERRHHDDAHENDLVRSMSAFGLAARWAHLVCGLGLVGLFGASLLAGRSDRPTARQWASRTIRLALWLVVASLVLGVATLAHQLIVASGQAGALLDPAMWRRLILQSRFGTVWLVR